MANKKTIPALFEEYAQHFPKHIAAIKDKELLTYGNLNEQANQFAYRLQSLGLKPDSPVVICLDRSFEFLIVLIAILKAGGAYLPIDASQPEERLNFLLQDSQAPILITQSLFKEKFASYQGTLLCVEEVNNISLEASQNLAPTNTPEHLAYIIYTSGSTGTPKGVLIEHGSVVNYCEWFATYTQCSPQQRIDFSSNPIFDMSVTTTLVPLMLGLTVVFGDENTKKNVSSYLSYVKKYSINIIKLTPSYFKVLVQEAKNNFISLPQLDSIILGGENLAAAECKSWLALYPEQVLFNEYGPTETTVAISTFKVDILNCTYFHINIPIGMTGTNINALVLDANNQPVADEEPGELFISGLCLARGYLNQAHLTQQQFITRNGIRFYKTGDLCKKHADGLLEYLGRMDEQVKIRGYRIEPSEINKHLQRHSNIKESEVLAQKDSFGDQRLVAYYTQKAPNTSINSQRLREYLQKHLPEYMIPAVFIKMDSFPLTANGKLDKAALPLPLVTATHNYVEPSSALEKKLARIWGEELGVPLISIHDDFFDLGGHSLSAARIISKINCELNKTILISDFYTTSTIYKLAILIKKTKKNKKKRIPRVLDYHKIINIPLSDFQFLLWMSNTFEPRAQNLNIVSKKRFFGRLSEAALEFAFHKVIKKHETLTYQILKLQPAQKKQNNWSFKLICTDLTGCALQNSEVQLQKSMTQLINLSSWPKNTALIMGKLFHLSEQESELQICIPHLIADDHCPDILFSELSLFYQQYNQIKHDEVEPDTSFKKHIFSQRMTMKMHLDADICFWKEYLHDTSLFTFPEEYLVHEMHTTKFAYSTYLPIPIDALNHLKLFCEQNHIGINSTLGAIIALALRNCCENQQSSTPYTYLNIIQSTRDHSMYDNTIGCFLRVEPIKIKLNENATLTGLSKEIRQAMIETSIHQHCSNLVKLCSISSLKPNRIENFISGFLIPIYKKLFRIPSIYHKILKQFGSRMISFKRNTKFFININIRDDFINQSNKYSKLFGLNTKPHSEHQDDLLAIDNIFEASFIRGSNQNTHYLVISANLKPEFRGKIAQEVISIMNSVAFENNHHLSKLQLDAQCSSSD